MNRALFFLFVTLLKRRVLRFLRDLRRPINFASVLVVGGLLAVLFYHRNDKAFVEFVKNVPLPFVLSIMFVVAVCRGFLQRGLACDEGDPDLLFTAPLRPQQLVLYRLLPAYLYAVLTGAFLLALIGKHLRHPLGILTCIMLLQIISFHAATAASLLAGSLSEVTFVRCRKVLWALMIAYAVGSFYFFSPPTDGPPRRGLFVWQMLSSGWAHLLFYPAVDLVDISLSPAVRDQAFHLARPLVQSSPEALRIGVCALSLTGVLAIILARLLGGRGRLFELALSASLDRNTDDTPARIPALSNQQDAPRGRQSARLPKATFCHGPASIIWKNLVSARRCRTHILVALGYSVLFTIPWVCLLMIMGNYPDLEDSFATGSAIPLSIGFLPILLQTTLPFDLRLETGRIMELRSLPISAFRVVLAILTVPVVFCLGFQALSILSMSFFGQFRAITLVSILFGYPAIALGVAAVWNFHSLLFFSRKHTKSGVNRAEGAVMAIALAIAIFFPAGFMLHKLSATPTLATAVAIAIQYAVDAGLILLLARLFGRFEGARSS